MTKQIVCFGEIMLRLSPFHFQRIEQAKSFQMDFGGSESNVAASLAQLGNQVDYITRVPDHPFGHAALSSLAQHGVYINKSIYGGDRLGIYFVEQGSGRRNSRVIYDRVQSGMHTISPGMIDWKTVLKDCSWFHWSGITPSISHSAALATKEALEIAQSMNIKISCDLNYRSKLWQYGKKPNEIMPELVAMSHVVMGDTDVMDVYFGIEVQDQNDAFIKLANRFKSIELIGMTDREGKSASHNTYQGFLYDRTDIYTSRFYDLPDMVDRIGSGDAFMAGLIHQLVRSEYSPSTCQEIVEFATACAVYKHYVPGDLNYFTEDDVYTLMKGNTGGKVKR